MALDDIQIQDGVCTIPGELNWVFDLIISFPVLW